MDNQIIKTCKIHGDLTQSQVRKEKGKGYTYLICIRCKADYSAKWRQLNKDKPEKYVPPVNSAFQKINQGRLCQMPK